MDSSFGSTTKKTISVTLCFNSRKPQEVNPNCSTLYSKTFFQVISKSACNLSQLDITLFIKDNSTNVGNGCCCFEDPNQEW